MDLENLVRAVALKIRPGGLLFIATSDFGVDLCLDSNGHWHERFGTTDKNHGSWPIEEILTAFAAMKGNVRAHPDDPDVYTFAKRVAYYMETHKQQLIDELMAALKRADQALTS